MAEKLTSKPAVFLTAGDVQARRKIVDTAVAHGMDPAAAEDLARKATLTNTPEWAASQKMKAFQQTNAATKIALPFFGTMASAVEQGIPRTPGLGLIAEAMQGGKRFAPEEIQRLMAEQGIGAGVMGAGAAAGYYGDDINIGDSDADRWASRALKGALTNMAGRYTVPAAMGFAAGTSLAGDDDDYTGAATNALKTGFTEYPMPGVEAFSELAGLPGDLAEEGIPGDLEEILEMAPGGAIPGLIKDIYLRKGPQAAIAALLDR